MELEIKVTSVFSKNLKAYEDGYRYLINQGGSRSSKSYSIIQFLIYLCLQSKITVSVVRKTLPSLKASILRDFVDIMSDLKLYDSKSHNKTDNFYTFDNGSIVEFFSLDDEQKVRGRKRDILFLNEANELDFKEYNQLVLRTSKLIVIDFNPSDTDCYIYDIIKEKNAILIKSTYKDNPFLEDEQIKYIENLINVDQSYYRIYALGETPIKTSRVYNHFKPYDFEVDGDRFFGIDFGYNDPTALVQIVKRDGKYFCKELIYQSYLTVEDLIKLMNELSISKNDYIYYDTSRPEVAESLRRSGFNMKGASKSIKDGIDFVKSKEIFIHSESSNIWNEYKKYSWKMKGDQVLDEPVDLHNHICDAIRYGIYTNSKNSGSFDYDFVMA